MWAGRNLMEERGRGGYPRQVSAKLSLDRQGGFSLCNWGERMVNIFRSKPFWYWSCFMKASLHQGNFWSTLVLWAWMFSYMWGPKWKLIWRVCNSILDSCIHSPVSHEGDLSPWGTSYNLGNQTILAHSQVLCPTRQGINVWDTRSSSCCG